MKTFIHKNGLLVKMVFAFLGGMLATAIPAMLKYASAHHLLF